MESSTFFSSGSRDYPRINRDDLDIAASEQIFLATLTISYEVKEN